MLEVFYKFSFEYLLRSERYSFLYYFNSDRSKNKSKFVNRTSDLKPGVKRQYLIMIKNKNMKYHEWWGEGRLCMIM